jgi:subtilisin family serine protease
VERGDITFLQKLQNVQAGGGVAAVIYNNAPGNFSGTLGAGNSSTIPAISLSQEDGQYLVANKLTYTGAVNSNPGQVGSGYAFFDGTSMATPHVSAAAALIWSYNPAMSNAQIRDALQKTAKDLGTAGRDTSYGFGLVQAKAALDFIQSGGGGGGGGDTIPPVISNVQGQKTGKGGTFKITWTTDEASTSVVIFTGGTTGTYTDSALVTSHSMSFRGKNGVKYTFSVRSADATGNTTTAGPFTHQN